MKMQPTRPLLRPVPKEQQRAHTISQRLRQLKKIPPELLPLGLAVGIALGAAVYSMVHAIVSDPTLELRPSRRKTQKKTH